jgi:hypothetical protein
MYLSNKGSYSPLTKSKPSTFNFQPITRNAQIKMSLQLSNDIFN